ncbi:PRC-barrel domain-containing protein [Paucibacter sp. M5-1]|uniref:PRC-barrel domain-containing protein n=1 Tax=Paucibacter sp. M5-1 TaxID=3015998 RepID=UPI0010F4CFA1|nr:PRC-barrel domain-containing protein [Paucibacter sp. M5-1]MCZ7880755.1 PRC-barrel domain-containing protein [Paucibacter sp. M5-1]
MLNSISQLSGSTLSASDGEVGEVKEAYFDDQAWTIRYLVVDTGSWLAGREVLISPYAVQPPLGRVKEIQVGLSREQVEKSPGIDTHKPVSRRHERVYLDYYNYPQYWGGVGLWAMEALPVLPPTGLQSQAEIERAEQDLAPEDVHLRSSANVSGYDIHALDGSLGHVKDFIFDEASWAIRYLVVDTRNWWPGGKKVLIATHWIDRIEWSEKTVYTQLTREQIKNSPEYDDSVLLNREFEERLHQAHGRPGYWD